MLDQPILSTIGLSLDIVGVVFLYLSGFSAPDIARPQLMAWGEPKHRRLAQFLSCFGIALLLIGFGLQIVAQWV